MSKRVQRVWNGKVIEGLKSVVMGRKKSAEVIACVNALLSWEVKSGQKTCGEIQISDSKTTLLLPKGSGTDSTPSSGEGGTRFRVKSVQGDYITCHTWDGSTEGSTNVLIAKPPNLRHSITSQTINSLSITYSGHNIDGGKCTRTASATWEGGTITQNEMVLPPWQIAGTSVAAEIWADEPTGGTGVTVSGNALTWIDKNLDGRAWYQI